MQLGFFVHKLVQAQSTPRDFPFPYNPHWWLAESDDHQTTFIHHRHTSNRWLHLNDRISFERIENPRKPGYCEGIKVQWLGSVVARQIEGPTVSSQPIISSNDTDLDFSRGT